MSMYAPFVLARPVWPEGMETEKNLTIGLHACVSAPTAPVTLRIAVSGFYRVFVNGEFVFYGPARCAHGFFRVDELPLSLPADEAHIAIETVNYYINSFDYIRQPGFIQAEITAGEQVLAATGGEGFALWQLNERVRKIQRYSYQRPAAEAYRLSPDYADWRVGRPGSNTVALTAVETEEKALVPRHIPLNTFPNTAPNRRETTGTLIAGVKPENYRKDHSLVFIENPNCGYLGGYPEAELDWHLTDDVQELKNTSFVPDGTAYSGRTALADGQFEILSLPCEKTGFITANVHCEKAGTLYFLVDETLRQNGDVDPLSMECCNVLRLDMTPGDYAFQAMNPVGFRYMKVVATEGSFVIDGLCLKELICPQPVTIAYEGSDPQLAAVFDAARETFLQNSSDLFMDCPTRERTGWLCDSFFTARAEWEFTGDNVIEKNFLENFLLPESFRDVPKGMLPMCYPADHNDGNFIPNWAMWFVLELEDRLFNRKGDREFVMSFRQRVYDLLDWCKLYENADGLLEKLPRWVFLEWSKANELTQDINFPSNMLYARTLEAAAHMFEDAALAEKAARLKEVIRARSFDGTYFVDNEVYNEDGVPVSSGERTETCQYYAFFCGVATPGTYPALWHTLVTDFGPDRAEKGLHPEIYPANAFIGNYLRLFLLEENELFDKLLSEIKGYFFYMAERTGTLWENVYENASCNHGFASCVVRFIRRAEAALK
ncbi:MAG: hypothetical protein J6K98_03650 [Clostridia bacterium]|nr:hypothetical protein [Clostridia bacterium]